MKKSFFYLFIFWINLAVSQNKQLIFGMTENPQALMLNPGATVLHDLHIGLPLLSQFHFNAGITGISIDDIFVSSDIDINLRLRNAVSDLRSTDFITLTQQLDILNFGWRKNDKIYYSGGIYQEFDFINYFPKDLAVLALEGNREFIGDPFNIGQVNFRGELLTVFHFGINKKVNKKLTIGARAKIYSSIFSVQSTNNSGSFLTRVRPNSDNILEHILDVDFSVKTSGIASLVDSEEDIDLVKTLKKRALLGGNLGLGLDFGATFEIDERWTVSGSVIDFGMVFNSKDVETHTAKGRFETSGIEFILPPLDDPDAEPRYTDILDEFDESVVRDTLTSAYIQLRPLKINGSISYGFGYKKYGNEDCDCLKKERKVEPWTQYIGAHLFSVFRPKRPQVALSLYYQKRWTNFLFTRITYTVDEFSLNNIGFGLTTNIGPLNFFVAADNILGYRNLAKAKSVSLQLGFNLKFYRK